MEMYSGANVMVKEQLLHQPQLEEELPLPRPPPPPPPLPQIMRRPRGRPRKNAQVAAANGVGGVAVVNRVSGVVNSASANGGFVRGYANANASGVEGAYYGFGGGPRRIPRAPYHILEDVDDFVAGGSGNVVRGVTYETRGGDGNGNGNGVFGEHVNQVLAAAAQGFFDENGVSRLPQGHGIGEDDANGVSGGHVVPEHANGVPSLFLVPSAPSSSNVVPSAAAAAAVAAASSSSGKRGRGRPPKKTILAGASSSSSSSSGKKRLGRPPKKKTSKITGSAIRGFTYRLITVEPGENVVSEVMSLSGQVQSFCIISAHGTISCVTLKKADSPEELSALNGQFHLLSLSCGAASSNRGDGLTVGLACPDGRVIGGTAITLTAHCRVEVVVATFTLNNGGNISQDTDKV